MLVLEARTLVLTRDKKIWSLKVLVSELVLLFVPRWR